MEEHRNAGEATADAQLRGDFASGEAAGPYGGADGQGGTASGTSEARPVEHVGDRPDVTDRPEG